MAAFNKVNDFVEDLLKGVHNLSTATLRLALSNTAPGSESSNPTASGNGVLANVTQIAYTNLSGGVAPALASVVVAESGGTATLDAANVVITASGGSVGPYRYVYLYNDTATGDPIIGYWDRGSSVTLADTETDTATISTVLLSLT
jgi:hypothetical protein